MKSVFLRKLLLLISSAVLLSSLLTAGLYVLFTNQLVINMKVHDLMPKARTIALLLSDVLSGTLNESDFIRFIGRDKEMWDAQLLLLDQNGNALTSAEMPGVDEEGISPGLQKQIARVMAGEEVEEVLNLYTQSNAMLVVGTPVKQDGVVIGAAFLAKPITELNSAMGSFRMVFASSLLIGLPIVCLFVYFTTRSFTRPMRHMRDTALAMARGDFQTFAAEDQQGEMGELAFSLNHLSRELAGTITQLTMERNRLQWVIDSIGDGIIALDANGDITHANPSIYRLWGVAMGNEDALREKVYPLIESAYARVNEGESACENIHLSDQVVLKMTVSPIADTYYGSAGVVVLFQDITESERLEQTRREYVANVSHELRTPLTALRGLIEPLNDGMVKREEDRARYYGIMLRETLRLARLVEDLMQLSRLQSGGEVQLAGVFSLQEVMLDVEEKCRINADEAGVALEVEPADVSVWGIRDRVEQVLVILLDNACKFTPDGGEVTMYAQESEDNIWVCVQDTGCGIAPNDLPYVFERFYKADRARSSGGTGLGLSIAKEILERMGEDILVESEPGQGACFRFSLRKA